MPKLSIITVNLNNKDGLIKTIGSVINQSYKDYEFIIIDGGSTDGSVEILEEYSDRISFWLSEKDSGIYNGMNKGIQNASGEYLQFLNSGDWLVDKDTLVNVFNNNFTEDIIYGNRFEVFNDRTILNKGHRSSIVTFKDVYQGCIFHSTAFIKKRLFDDYGYYDEDFKIISDYIFFLKTIGLGTASTKYVDENISYFDMNGISKSKKYWDLQVNEIKKAKEKYVPPPIINDYDRFLEYDRIFRRLKKYKIGWFGYRLLNKFIVTYEKVIR